MAPRWWSSEPEPSATLSSEPSGADSPESDEASMTVMQAEETPEQSFVEEVRSDGQPAWVTAELPEQ